MDTKHWEEIEEAQRARGELESVKSLREDKKWLKSVWNDILEEAEMICLPIKDQLGILYTGRTALLVFYGPNVKHKRLVYVKDKEDWRLPSQREGCLFKYRILDNNTVHRMSIPQYSTYEDSLVYQVKASISNGYYLYGNLGHRLKDHRLGTKILEGWLAVWAVWTIIHTDTASEVIGGVLGIVMLIVVAMNLVEPDMHKEYGWFGYKSADEYKR